MKTQKKRSFVLVIQSIWISEIALQITLNLAWAIDNFFKAKQYEKLLYVAMCPNNRGYGMFIFYALF